MAKLFPPRPNPLKPNCQIPMSKVLASRLWELASLGFRDFLTLSIMQKGEKELEMVLSSQMAMNFQSVFDLKTLHIPSLTSATTKFLGLPLPPLLKIDLVPQLFQGNINQDSCKVDLECEAKFCFSVGSIYKAVIAGEESFNI